MTESDDLEMFHAELAGVAIGLMMMGADSHGEVVKRACRRLEALEEIRQRVADGWHAWPTADMKGQGVWLCIYGERDEKHIEPSVAAVLWPTTEPEWSGGTMSDAIEENTGD